MGNVHNLLSDSDAEAAYALVQKAQRVLYACGGYASPADGVPSWRDGQILIVGDGFSGVRAVYELTSEVPSLKLEMLGSAITAFAGAGSWSTHLETVYSSLSSVPTPLNLQTAAIEAAKFGSYTNPPPAMLWQGAWSSGAAYRQNDVVTLAGAAYVCVLGHTNQTPPNGTYWAIVAEAVP